MALCRVKPHLSLICVRYTRLKLDVILMPYLRLICISYTHLKLNVILLPYLRLICVRDAPKARRNTHALSVIDLR